MNLNCYKSKGVPKHWWNKYIDWKGIKIYCPQVKFYKPTLYLLKDRKFKIPKFYFTFGDRKQVDIAIPKLKVKLVKLPLPEISWGQVRSVISIVLVMCFISFTVFCSIVLYKYTELMLTYRFSVREEIELYFNRLTARQEILEDKFNYLDSHAQVVYFKDKPKKVREIIDRVKRKAEEDLKRGEGL